MQDGLGRDTIRGVVYEQIDHPARLPKTSPVYMPPKLVEGKLAGDVAAYVASVVVAARQGHGPARHARSPPPAPASRSRRRTASS